MARIVVGTSGWVYPHWKRRFYPKGLAEAGWLAYYARIFPTVELNATFYRLPTAEAAARWRSSTPPGFGFAAKGSRFLTHMKRLLDTGRGLDRFFAPLGALGDKLEVVLWQLPPQMKPDLARLENFLAALPRSVRQVFEFRDPAWHVDEVCAALDRHGVAICEHDLVDVPPPRPTGGFRYVRFHGTRGEYRGRYGSRALSVWARSLALGAAHGLDAYVYFNNDGQAHAVMDALDLLAALERVQSIAIGSTASAIGNPRTFE